MCEEKLIKDPKPVDNMYIPALTANLASVYKPGHSPRITAFVHYVFVRQRVSLLTAKSG